MELQGSGLRSCRVQVRGAADVRQSSDWSHGPVGGVCEYNM